MILEEMRNTRLLSQQITSAKFKKAEELVAWFCGIQAQDYPSAKWGIGLRLPSSTDQIVEQAVADHKIVRSWIMRGTLHITTTLDIRWMLDLLAPRIIQSSAGRNRQLELDNATFTKSNNLLCRTLEDGKQLTRDELSSVFEKNGISPSGQRLYHMLHRAALEKLICFGPRRNKQLTFVLLDENAPMTKSKIRDEALFELANRYFASRGPATLDDFVWWSGLTKTDAKKGLESVRSLFQEETIDRKQYFFTEKSELEKSKPNKTFLLPAFDEYVIAYRDRSALLSPQHSRQVISTNGIFYPVIVSNGEVVGTWRRIFKKNQVLIELNPFEKPRKAIENEMIQSAQIFGKFTDKDVVIR